MKIIQISDLHIGARFSMEEYEGLLDELVAEVKALVDGREDMQLVCCGDVVDRGDARGYDGRAREVFERLKHELAGCWCSAPLLVPGNHDVCGDTQQPFFDFVDRCPLSSCDATHAVTLLHGDGFDFVLVNTAHHLDPAYGDVDLEQLRECLGRATQPAFIVMHHTLMSRYPDDSSPVRNAYAFIDLVDQYDVIGILHGHTHGYSDVLVGNACRVVGVGPLFRHIPNCNDQFNVVEVMRDGIVSVKNYRYQSDLGRFSQEVLYDRPRQSRFVSDSVSRCYEDVCRSVRERGGIHHLSLRVATSVGAFQDDMRSHFKSDIELARRWLQDEVPDDLCYNHGSFMRCMGPSGALRGIDYAISELERNATSNRAIIPLVNINDVNRIGSDHLPGLCSVQFGFHDDTKTLLCCSMYLRSLEVSRFLRINLSEIYLLVSHICDRIRSVTALDLYLYAFKGQYRESFACFRKAQIDRLSAGQLSRVVYMGDVEGIVGLLREKFELHETVVMMGGIMMLRDIMTCSGMYPSACIECLDVVVAGMRCLADEYRRSSDYASLRASERRLEQDQERCLKRMAEACPIHGEFAPSE